MITPGQLRAYAAQSMPEDNISTSGGAISTTTLIDFSDLTVVGPLQVVSSSSGDTRSLLITGRNANGLITEESVVLTGRTPVQTVFGAWERLMKVVKSDQTSGDVAVEQVTPVWAGNVVASNVDQVTIETNASSLDNYYTGMVFRVLTGTSAGSIAKVVAYRGSTRRLTLSRSISLDTSSAYILTPGFVFFKTPHEIFTVRRPFYGVAAAGMSGSERVFYEKFFWKNNSGETLQLAQIKEISNPTGKILFAVDPIVPSTSSVANRLTRPLITNLSFGRLPQAMPSYSPDLASGQAVGVWMSFTVPATMPPTRSLYVSGIVGQTV